jgi:ribonuclease HII
MVKTRRAAGQPSRLPFLPYPTARYEQRAWRGGAAIVAGADEAGRGAWAGPLVAAAAIWPRNEREQRQLLDALGAAGAELRDSKQLSHQQRMLARDTALTAGARVAVAVIPVDELDAVGLGTANKLALMRSIAALEPAPEFALIDAFRLNVASCGCEAVVRGDQQCLSIALASIVAKTYRDDLMRELDACYPGYGFATHKGYGTAAHATALEQLGPSPAHRRCFAPVARLLDDVDA